MSAAARADDAQSRTSSESGSVKIGPFPTRRIQNLGREDGRNYRAAGSPLPGPLHLCRGHQEIFWCDLSGQRFLHVGRLRQQGLQPRPHSRSRQDRRLLRLDPVKTRQRAARSWRAEVALDQLHVIKTESPAAVDSGRFICESDFTAARTSVARTEPPRRRPRAQQSLNQRKCSRSARSLRLKLRPISPILAVYSFAVHVSSRLLLTGFICYVTGRQTVHCKPVWSCSICAGECVCKREELSAAARKERWQKQQIGRRTTLNTPSPSLERWTRRRSAPFEQRTLTMIWHAVQNDQIEAFPLGTAPPGSLHADAQNARPHCDRGCHFYETDRSDDLASGLCAPSVRRRRSALSLMKPQCASLVVGALYRLRT